jgi:nitrite reductase/ring-hydroxylating ferredoxin subunit
MAEFVKVARVDDVPPDALITVECPFHGGQFDVRTGAAVALPAFEGVPVYEVRIDGNDITVARP